MIGINTKCFICMKIITSEDAKPENNNRPMKMMSIPGFVHRKCKIGGEADIMDTAFNETDLTKEIDKL